MKKELTLKQKAFADYYIQLGNATEAAIQAGYSKKTARSIGQENLTKPDIKSYIDERMAEIKSNRIAKAEEVLEYLTAVMRGEHKEQTLRGLGEGYQEIDDIDVAASQRIKAAELLGKRHMLWTDKQQVEMVVPTFVNDVPLDDEDES